MEDTREALAAWGREAKYREARGYPAMTPFARLYKSPAKAMSPPPQMPDADFMTVDGALAAMRLANPSAYSVVYDYYVKGQSILDIAGLTGTQKDKVRELRDFALAWVMSRLYPHISQEGLHC
jgi:hypothetical protein